MRYLPVEIKPTVRITSQQLPELDKVQVGDKLSLKIYVTVKGMNELTDGGVEYIFEVRSAQLESFAKLQGKPKR